MPLITAISNFDNPPPPLPRIQGILLYYCTLRLSGDTLSFLVLKGSSIWGQCFKMKCTRLGDACVVCLFGFSFKYYEGCTCCIIIREQRVRKETPFLKSFTTLTSYRKIFLIIQILTQKYCLPFLLFCKKKMESAFDVEFFLYLPALLLSFALKISESLLSK